MTLKTFGVLSGSCVSVGVYVGVCLHIYIFHLLLDFVNRLTAMGLWLTRVVVEEVGAVVFIANECHFGAKPDVTECE